MPLSSTGMPVQLSGQMECRRTQSLAPDLAMAVVGAALTGLFVAIRPRSSYGRMPSLVVQQAKPQSAMTDRDVIFTLRSTMSHGLASVVARRAGMQPSMPDAGVALLSREDVKAKVKAQFDNEKWWRVLLHNDDIHTFEYVTGSLTQVVKHLSRRKAYIITWEAHSAEMATVATVWKALAEEFCAKLQQLGLTVSIAPDKQFKNSKFAS